LAPLLYEPGENWAYSVSIDWAGKMVERVNGGISLGEYMEKNIFEPLGMTSTGFRPEKNQKISGNLCPTTKRTPEGDLVPTEPYAIQDPKDDLGGGGLYSAAPDYVKVLISLLKNDGKLLRPETVKLMFSPQLSDDSHLIATVNEPFAGPMFRGGVDSAAWNFGLGGILNMEDVDGVCKKGTLTWGGLPNLFWVCQDSSLITVWKLTHSSGLIPRQAIVACMPLSLSHQETQNRWPLGLRTERTSSQRALNKAEVAYHRTSHLLGC
jgi:CubicO group peptidase (beta-lactamase class C family)